MASIIDHDSSLSSKSELSLFSVPPTQVAVQKKFYDEYHLQNPISDSGPYIFHVPPDVNMIDAHHHYIHVVLRIVHGNGNRMAAVAGVDAIGGVAAVAARPHPFVGPIQLLGKTLFRNVRIFMSGRQIYDANNLYSYRAILESNLNYGSDAKLSHLQAAGYYPDNNVDTDKNVNNDGLKARAKLFENSGEVELIAPLHCEIFNQDRFLLSNLDLRIELHRNSDAFCLLTSVDNADFKLQFVSMKLMLKKVEVSPSLALALEGSLLRSVAKYPIRRVGMSTMHLEGGRLSTPVQAVLSGQIPRRLLIVLTELAAFHGHYHKSPFNFKNFNISEAKVIAGGQVFPNLPLKADFANKKYMEMFANLFEVLGIETGNLGNGVTWESFGKSDFVIAFDLSPDSEADSGHWELARSGTVSLDLQFREEIPTAGIQLIMYAEYDSMLSIDRNRQPIFDYSLT